MSGERTTPSEIDTVGSAAASRTWVQWGDAVSGSRLRFEVDLTGMYLDELAAAAGSSLASAATDLWTVAVFLQLVVARVEGVDASATMPIDPGTIDGLMRLAGERSERQEQAEPAPRARSSRRAQVTCTARTSPRCALPICSPV